jgi:sorbin and SH3 domain-containing protein 1
VHKKVNQDWYLGEHHGSCGLFPASYVHFLENKNDTKDNIQSLKNKLVSLEGMGKVKFDFKPQTKEELEMHKVIIEITTKKKMRVYKQIFLIFLLKGEFVSIIRRIDANWYEGHIGHKEGIFPVQYVHVLKEPETSKNFVENRSDLQSWHRI